MATIRQLEEADWFANTGKPDTDVAMVVTSWSEAVDRCSSPEWNDLRLEASNQYRMRLMERSRDRFSRWNDITQGLKPSLIPFVKRKIQPFLSTFNLPQKFEDSVQWDILLVCMEAEYADVFPPGFYSANAFWYTVGHFPCGWEGDFPSGRPVVF